MAVIVAASCVCLTKQHVLGWSGISPRNPESPDLFKMDMGSDVVRCEESYYVHMLVSDYLYHMYHV